MILQNGGLAQLARASALHAEGHRFDSDILHRSSFKQEDVIHYGDSFGSSPTHLQVTQVISSLTYWKIKC